MLSFFVILCFCVCLSPKTYWPIPISTSIISQSPEKSDLEDTFNQPPERNDLDDTINKYPERNGLEIINDEEVLTNIASYPKKTYLEIVSSLPSTDDESLSKVKPEKEQDLHLSQLSFGVSIIVKVHCDKDKS
ncbi:hypothetical protein FQA39_LY11285 [Lamprigera yunnana]|nr:hypothetical protein FQA39_LY11285 [Lamprigera yunnana]